MIAVVISIVILAGAGAFVVRAIDPSLSRGAAAGAGFMTGCGMASLAMMVLSVVGMRWSFPLIVVLLAGAAAAAAAVRRRRRVVAVREPVAWSPVATAVDALTAISLSGYALFATIARPWEWDFWAIWGLRARAEFVVRGIDVAFLANPDVEYSHPDYPPLVSNVFALTALARGEWDDRWLGVIFVAFALALLLVVRDEMRRSTGSEVFSALAVLVLSGAACTPWVGLADGPLVACGTAALLVLARSIREDDARALILAGTLFGVGAMMKNEGLALLVAAALSLALFRPRRMFQFVVPAAILAVPWLAFRATLDLATDVVSGGVASRIVARLSDPAEFISVLASGTPDRAGFWLILLLVLVLGRRDVVRRHGVMLVAVGIQLLCYVVIYAGTMHDLASHVQTSMGRVSGHLAAAVGALCALAIWDLFLSESLVKKEPSDE